MHIFCNKISKKSHSQLLVIVQDLDVMQLTYFFHLERIQSFFKKKFKRIKYIDCLHIR